MADTTPALNRSEDMGAWMIWLRVQPVFLAAFFKKRKNRSKKMR